MSEENGPESLLPPESEAEIEAEIEQVLREAPPETPEDGPARKAIREALELYERTAPVRFNPDASVVERIIDGLEARERKTGMRLCPCRLARGDPAEDQKIVCPCVYHLEEVERDGHCHCWLFVKRP